MIDDKPDDIHAPVYTLAARLEAGETIPRAQIIETFDQYVVANAGVPIGGEWMFHNLLAAAASFCIHDSSAEGYILDHLLGWWIGMEIDTPDAVLDSINYMYAKHKEAHTESDVSKWLHHLANRPSLIDDAFARRAERNAPE